MLRKISPGERTSRNLAAISKTRGIGLPGIRRDKSLAARRQPLGILWHLTLQDRLVLAVLGASGYRKGNRGKSDEPNGVQSLEKLRFQASASRRGFLSSGCTSDLWRLCNALHLLSAHFCNQDTHYSGRFLSCVLLFCPPAYSSGTTWSCSI